MTPFAYRKLAMKTKPIRVIVEKVVGVTAHCLSAEVHLHELVQEAREGAHGPFPKGRSMFFHGCAGGYFEIATSRATVEVLEARL